MDDEMIPARYATRFRGAHATAERIDTPGAPAFWFWLVTVNSPGSPQWLIAAGQIRPSNARFIDATHSLLVGYVGDGKYSRDLMMLNLSHGGSISVLFPLFYDQFEASDAEIAELAALQAWAVSIGDHLPLTLPETDEQRMQSIETWLTSCVQTLAHGRGEPHGDLS